MAILDFSVTICFKVVSEMVKKVIFGQMGTVNHFANKNGRVAIFITTMADGGHLFFFQLY